MRPGRAPFHCSFMAPAGARLASELEAAQVADPEVPVVRNVDAGVTRRAEDVRPFLLRQVANPVRWTECVQRLAAEGATTFVEVGPGRVLSGLLRRIVNGARGQSIEDPAGLEKALAAAKSP
jgi:[acyl-carrier-protein] S-malonyltransferase